jgi:predicted kinase
MREPTLYLMLGYPGAGKTTTARVIHELTGAEHLWADLVRRDMFGKPKYTHTENIQLYEHMNNMAEDLLAQGKDVIFDTNFNFYKDRQRLREIADNYSGQTIVIWVTTPRSIARKRATDGGGHHTRVLGDMPVETFERMSSNLQEPRPDETVVEVDGTKVTPGYIANLLHIKK